MIVDEADLSLNNLVSFDRTALALNGLYHLKSAKKVIYMSATMPEYFKGVIKQTLGGFEYNHFKSQYQLTTNDKDPYFIEDFNFASKEEMTEKLVEDISALKNKSKSELFPMIFFIEEWDD